MDSPGESCTDTKYKNGFLDTEWHVVGPWLYINSAHLMHTTLKTVLRPLTFPSFAVTYVIMSELVPSSGVNTAGHFVNPASN